MIQGYTRWRRSPEMEWPCWKGLSLWQLNRLLIFAGCLLCCIDAFLSLVLSLPVLLCQFKTSSPKLIEVFAYLFLFLLAFIIKSLILLELLIIFLWWGKKRIKFHGLACECPVFSIVEETINSIVSSLCILGSFAKKPRTIYVWIYFWTLFHSICRYICFYASATLFWLL